MKLDDKLNESSSVIIKNSELISPDLSEYTDRVRRLIEASVAPETKRAYSSRLKRFFNWCELKGFNYTFPISPEILAAYLVEMADNGFKYSTIEQTIAAISTAHKANGFISPTESLLIKKFMKGCKREYGTAKKKHDAATADIVRYLLNSIPDDSSPKHIRDRAIIALGFAGAFRRSELCALNVENLKWTFKNGQEILLAEIVRSKTDQEGHGMIKAIFPSNDDENISPTHLLKRWLYVGNIFNGALFRRLLKDGHITPNRLTPQSIRLIVKNTAVNAGLSLDLSAHSLRSGFVTTAIRQGKSERSIMNQTGHKSTQVLREYFIREDAVEDNAANNII
ncbi:MAG: tyrosine-type recombinase/integrase [Synergistaceae bacterium]|nr:tyrosine-type recombinase/integrase [Synergistaceae bacterium]